MTPRLIDILRTVHLLTCDLKPKSSPVASAGSGDSPAGVSVPPTPPAGHQDPPSTVSPLPGVDGEGPGPDCVNLPTPEPGHPNLTEAIAGVLEDHRFYVGSSKGSDPFDFTYHCATALGALHKTFDAAGYPGACDQWNEHVAELIAEAVQHLYWKRGPMGEPVPIPLKEVHR